MIGLFLGIYYLILILFDLLKSNNTVVRATNHLVHYEKSENPIIISGDSEEINLPVNLGNDENIKKYLPTDDLVKNEDVVKKSSPIVDLRLETISADAYTLSAENLSKFMFH
jgi:hypothetical protein